MKPTASTSTVTLWLGTICCLLSAVCYTATNICLRQLAALEVDPAWVVCVRESIAVILVAPWLIWRQLRAMNRPPVEDGKRVPFRAIAALAVAGLACGMAGLGVQWAFGINGLVISMPLVFGVMLIASALLGVLLFGEHLPFRSVFAVGMVIFSIVLLAIGATGGTTGSETAIASQSVLLVILAIGTASLGGAVFAGLGATIRYGARRNVPVMVSVFVVTGVGMVATGILSWVRFGTQLFETPRESLIWMVAAGVFNLLGFMLITKGLQLTTLAHANVLNASQVALGAAAGIIFFSEPRNVWLLSGIVLTIAAISLYADPRRKNESSDRTKASTA